MITPEELEFLAERVHEGWMRIVEKQGKDHKNLVPYRELSEDDKEKDRETVRSVVEALGELEGKKIGCLSDAGERYSGISVEAFENIPYAIIVRLPGDRGWTLIEEKYKTKAEADAAADRYKAQSEDVKVVKYHAAAIGNIIAGLPVLGPRENGKI